MNWRNTVDIAAQKWAKVVPTFMSGADERNKKMSITGLIIGLIICAIVIVVLSALYVGGDDR